MKLLYLLICLMGCYVSLNASTETTNHRFCFNEDDYTFSYNENGEMIIVPSKPTVYSDDNEPALPYYALNIALPAGGKYLSSSSSFSKKLLKSNVIMAQNGAPIPSYLQQIDGANPLTITYTDAVYPSSNCKFIGTSSWGGYSLVHFVVCPFVYDANNHKLHFVEFIDIDISLSKDDDAAPPFVSSGRRDILKNISSNIAINDTEDTGNNPMPISPNIDYILVTSKNLMSSFEPLIEWKNKKGLYCQAISIESIEENFNGDNLPHKIKNCLYDYYKNNNVKYVLLGGDDSVVPTRGCYGEVASVNSPYVDNSIPTDLYYSCFDGNFSWDGNGNGIYGEIDDGVDFGQSIIVTRAPVRTDDDVSAFVNRTIKYEQNPTFNNTLLMCGAQLWGNVSENQSDAEWKGDKIYKSFIEPNWKGERVKFYDTNTDFTLGADYDFTADNLLEQLNSGYSFVDVSTHGTKSSWSMERGRGYNDTYGRIQLNNGFSLITTMACLTNAFDDSYIWGNGDPCLSESLIRNPNSGVIGYFGSSRYGWGRSGQSLGTSLQYQAQFYEYLFSPTFEEKNFGLIVAATKASKIAFCGSNGSFRWLQYSINPIGDPEMPIFIEEPKKFNRIFKCYIGGQATITPDVDGCRVCISGEQENGTHYYKVIENTSCAHFDDLGYGVFDVCVTKPGYIPECFKISNSLIKDSSISGPVSVSCSPNPTTDRVSVAIDLENESYNTGRLTITNINGEIVHMASFNSTQDELTVDVSSLRHGTYIVSLFADGVLVGSCQLQKR